jgi:hypothetical protein
MHTKKILHNTGRRLADKTKRDGLGQKRIFQEDTTYQKLDNRKVLRMRNWTIEGTTYQKLDNRSNGQ